MSKKLLYLIGILLSIIIFLVVIFFIFAKTYLHSSHKISEPTIILVQRGASFKQVTTQLKQNRLIAGDERLFFYIARILHRDKLSIQSGEYLFEHRTSPAHILKTLKNGDVVRRKVTISEGLTTKEALDIVDSAYGLQGEIPQNIKEGSLLPETYFYSYGDSKTDLIERMQNALNQAIDELWQKRAPNLPIKTKKQALILASIIEKESGVNSEKGKISSVFINRLNKRIRLQSDPTVIYAITKGQYKMKRPISKKDLKIQSPFSTYYAYGLPPHPIANPGRSSIEAALNPLETNYLYFVASGIGGTHNFSTNLKQHNRYVQNYRALLREKELMRKTPANKN